MSSSCRDPGIPCAIPVPGQMYTYHVVDSKEPYGIPYCPKGTGDGKTLQRILMANLDIPHQTLCSTVDSSLGIIRACVFLPADIALHVLFGIPGYITRAKLSFNHS